MLSPPHRCLQNRARLSSAGPKANVAPNAFTTLPLLSKSRGNAKEMRRALPCRLRDNFGFRKMSESAIENHKSSKARNSEATQMIAGCESAGPARPQPGGQLCASAIQQWLQKRQGFAGSYSVCSKLRRRKALHFSKARGRNCACGAG